MTASSKWLCIVSLLALGACKSDGGDNAGNDGSVAADMHVAAADGGTADAATAACTPQEVQCVDTSISTLDLFDTVSTKSITEEGTTSGEFSTYVDATGGGFAPTESFVYARFTDAGLEKVEIDDEAAFDSSGWDIAFRRYVIRVNSGVSGPSCVQAGRTAPGTTFESLTAVPGDITFHSEAYFTGTCDFVPDGSGLEAPGTVLSSYWTYPGCVSMTHNVYVIALANGRHVKFEVKSYYPPANQEMCETSNTVPTPSGGGALRVRWAFLD